MAAKRQVTNPKRGEVYLVSFDPTIGEDAMLPSHGNISAVRAEIQKTRPALVLQNDVANEYSPITMVAAITSQFDETLYPTEVLIQPPEGGLTVNSVVLLNQIRSINKQRLVKRLGNLTEVTMEQVNQAIQISLGLVAL